MDARTQTNLLAWWLQAGVVVLVAAPLPRLLGLWAPRVRMAYWRVVLVGCLLLPLMQPWVVRQEPPASSGTETVADVAGAVTAAIPTAPPTPVPFWKRPLPFGATEVLVAGVFLRLGWLGLGAITVGRLRRSARRLWPRPGSVDRAATLAETDAEFLVSATASRPVTCGVLWPVVLVPRTFESFPDNEQMAIACHELLHVNRSDWIRNAIDEVVRAVLWFHPGIWWLINQIQLAREQVVDREAVRRLGARQAYLEALLRMARPAPRLNLSPATLFLKRAHLRQRVTLIVKEVSMSKARLAATLVVMAAVIVIGGSFATSAFPLQQAGAATPGVVTAAPTLSITKPMSFSFGPGVKRAQILEFISRATGLVIGADADAGPGLTTTVDKFERRDITIEQALAAILEPVGLTYSVVGPNSIVVRRVKGPGSSTRPGGVSGSVRPGVAAGTGTGSGGGAGVGSGGSAGVSGGVTGGVSSGVSGGVSGGVAGGVVGGVTGGVIEITGRDVAPWRASWPQDAVRVGGTLKPPIKITDVRPVYPEIARTARVQGVVICEALIGADGKVADAHILRSIPPLDQAALEAVSQWEFAPTLLNGNPVPVIMTTTVTFTLDGGVLNTGTGDQAQATVTTTPLAVPAGWPPPIRVGGNIMPPGKIVDVKPAYPAIAEQARVQGTVICEALIGPDGKVADVRILRSIALLDQAAIDAVRQWEYRPTLLNGTPVPVIMTVTVTFTLQ